MLGRALPYRDADGAIQGCFFFPSLSFSPFAMLTVFLRSSSWSGTCTDFDELYHVRFSFFSLFPLPLLPVVFSYSLPIPLA
jgi:hypothetical protein